MALPVLEDRVAGDDWTGAAERALRERVCGPEPASYKHTCMIDGEGGRGNPPRPPRNPPAERDALVLANWGWAHRCALTRWRKEWNRGSYLGGYTLEDATSDALAGLLRAAELYDPRKPSQVTGGPVAFTTYSAAWMEQFMTLGLMRCRQSVRYTRHEKEHLGLPPPVVMRLDHRWRHMADGGPRRAEEWREAPCPKDAGRQRAREAAEFLEWLLRRLHPKQRRVLELMRLEGKTLRQAGKALGVCREMARKLERQALSRLHALADRALRGDCW